MTCRVCGRTVDPWHPDDLHDVVKRFNTKEGPGPFPYPDPAPPLRHTG